MVERRVTVHFDNTNNNKNYIYDDDEDELNTVTFRSICNLIEPQSIY